MDANQPLGATKKSTGWRLPVCESGDVTQTEKILVSSDQGQAEYFRCRCDEAVSWVGVHPETVSLHGDFMGE